MGLIECDQDDLEAARSSLEHLVPKAKGALFCDLISNLAGLACWEGKPHCSACPLAGDCPTAQELKRTAGVAVGGRGRPKPRTEARGRNGNGPPAQHKRLAAPEGFVTQSGSVGEDLRISAAPSPWVGKKVPI